jgi:threonine dehydrogenase-like Zn-dependent dehydrogenase
MLETEGLFITGPRQVGTLPIELPDPGATQVLVAGGFLAVCGGELERFSEPKLVDTYPVQIGHELSGRVIAKGRAVKTLEIGDRVATWPTVMTAGGESLATATGGRHWLAEERYCVRGVSLKALALAEPGMCAYNSTTLPGTGVEGLGPDEDIIFVGFGFMNQVAMLAALLRGPRSVGVAVRDPNKETHTERTLREFALALGADYVSDTNDDLGTATLAATGGRAVSTIYEGTGVQEGLTLAEQLVNWEVRPHQNLVVVGYHQSNGGRRVVDEARLDVAGVNTIRGHWRDRNLQIMPGMRAVVALMNRGQLEVERLVSHTFPIASAQEAMLLGAARTDGYNKILINLA